MESESKRCLRCRICCLLDLPFRKYYYPIDAYSNSKLAQVYFSKHLNVLLKEQGAKVQVHSVHPGIVNTDLFEHSVNTAIPWFKNLFYKVSQIQSLYFDR